MGPPHSSGELPTDRLVVCVCRVGGRSLAVAGHLADRGFDVRNLTGGMQVWESSGRPVVTPAGAPGQVV